ncbi:unnamed protein product, partial [Oppiella nova]
VFLIDPLLLYQLIDEKSRRLLKQRDLSPVRSMAMYREYCQSFGKALDQEMAKQSYSISSIDGLDGSQRHFANEFTLIDKTILHIFYTKHRECLQISVFHKRHDFLWLGALPMDHIQSDDMSVSMDLHYGKHESAFDSFSLQSVKTAQNVSLLIPDKIIHFMSQYKSSKFIECNYSLAKDFAHKHSQDLTESRDMDNRVRDGLTALKTLTSKLLIPFFITSGTLLGWHRQCGVIPYTGDVDTGTWATYASVSLIDAFVHNNESLELSYIYGFIENSLQFAMHSTLGLRIDMFFAYREGPNVTFTGHISERKAYFQYMYPDFILCSAELVMHSTLGLRIDMFFAYREGPNVTFTGHISERKAYFQYMYPDFILCSAELVGLKVLVPCNPEAVISAVWTGMV